MRSNCVRLIESIRCFGTPSMAVMNGRFTSVDACCDRSFLARSAMTGKRVLNSWVSRIRWVISGSDSPSTSHCCTDAPSVPSP